MSTDPILDAILGEGEYEEETVEFDGEYGKGQWPNAILTEVTPQDARYDINQKEIRSFMFKANLKGDSMPFTWFVDFPGEAPVENGDAEAYEKAVKRHQVQVNRLKTLIHATGALVTFDEKGKVAKKGWLRGLEANFEKLTAVLQHLIGSKIALNVKFRTWTGKDGEERTQKDVWGLTPKAE